MLYYEQGILEVIFMATVTAVDPAKIADITCIAGKLQELPRDVQLYIAGYVDCMRARLAIPPEVQADGRV